MSHRRNPLRAGGIDQEGVFPPEMMDPDPFIKMLPKYGMNYNEKKL